jgi:predicted O-methyltransferase YrrM
MAIVTANKILQEIESNPHNRMIIGRKRGHILVRIMQEFQPRKILEIGTNVGYSTILMGKELEPRSHITTIEINPELAQKARDNIQRANVEPTIEIIEGDALELLPKLNGEFDFIFIDAQKDQYCQYLRLLEDNIYRGTMIIADNAGRYADQMKDYLDHVRSSGKYTSRFIAVDDDGVELSIRR